MVRWQDYQGPFEKVVGAFGRRLERKSLHEPHYKPGVILCTLTFKDKFLLFAQDTIDPITFLAAGFNAGVSQAEDDDRSYGQGASGYGTRFGFNLIDQAQSDFFGDFAYPVIFSEDPRYYRLGEGSIGRRILHAVEHAAVAHHEDGSPMPNYSDWFGTASAIALSNVYHPDNRRGFAPAAERFGWVRRHQYRLRRAARILARDCPRPQVASSANGIRGIPAKSSQPTSRFFCVSTTHP